MKNIVLRSFQILCTFVLRGEKVTIFAAISAQKWQLFPLVIQIQTKFQNVAGLYFPYFTTFRHQTLPFY